MSEPNEIILMGLDGSNPLGFMAAVGALCAGPSDWRLSWRRLDAWRPVLHGPASADAVLDALEADLARWRSNAPCLDIEYVKVKKGKTDAKSKEAKKGAADAKIKTARDLKPPPAVWRALLLASQRRDSGFADADFFVAFGSEFVTDHGGNVKPTALHFTAGQQEFIAVVQELLRGDGRAKGVGRDALAKALLTPWRYEGTLKTLRWDGATSRDYALRASDPSKDKTATEPGAEWLAFRALALLPSAPRGARLTTARCAGGWKASFMTWPMWHRPAHQRTIASLLQARDLATLTPKQRAARGIGDVLSSAVTRSDSGGYGSFGPGRIASSDDCVPKKWR